MRADELADLTHDDLRATLGSAIAAINALPDEPADGRHLLFVVHFVKVLGAGTTAGPTLAVPSDKGQSEFFVQCGFELEVVSHSSRDRASRKSRQSPSLSAADGCICVIPF